MTWPAVLVDEDFPLAVARTLRERSASAVEITVEDDRRSGEDDEQVARAAQLGGVLLSHNQRERGRFDSYVRAWRGRGDQKVAVLFLPHDPDPDRLYLRTAMLLDWYVELPLPKRATLVWNDAAQALIRGFRPAGYEAAELRRALGQQ